MRLRLTPTSPLAIRSFRLNGMRFRLIAHLQASATFIRRWLVHRISTTRWRLSRVDSRLVTISTSITAALEKCTGAPGRFERVAHDGDFSVVVDYAHSDDALLNVLRTAREVVKGKIITVFGCGGDRDRSKRAPMGEAAGSLSDVVILTSDNPRTEDPEQILCDAEEGIQKTGKPYRKIADRTRSDSPGDLGSAWWRSCFDCGQGPRGLSDHRARMFHFDDKEVARAALAQRG